MRKLLLSLMALMMFLPACVGGELTMQDPCEPGFVLTGGWEGDWTAGEAKCVPEPDLGTPDAGDTGGDPDLGDPDSGDSGPDADMDGGDMDGGDMECDLECCGPECPPPCEGPECPCVGDDCPPPCEEDCCGPDCPVVCEGEEVLGHRIVGIVLQLTNPDVPVTKARRLTENAMGWVTHDHPCPGVKVLVVRDDDHNDEFKDDPIQVRDWLRDAGYDVTFKEEPQDGLRWRDVKHYDAVWFSNPGHPIDDARTITTLEAFVAQGGGLVMSGDDLSWGQHAGVSTEGLVHLENYSNGTRTCEVLTDNNRGESYKVSMEQGPHPVLAGLEGHHFLYANDIDHSTPLGLGEEILAWAELDPALQCECDVHTPVIVVKDVAPYCIDPPVEEPPSECDETCGHAHPGDCPHQHQCPHQPDPECLGDDGHPRQGHGYGHCKNAENPGHCHHGEDCED